MSQKAILTGSGILVGVAALSLGLKRCAQSEPRFNSVSQSTEILNVTFQPSTPFRHHGHREKPQASRQESSVQSTESAEALSREWSDDSGVKISIHTLSNGKFALSAKTPWSAPDDGTPATREFDARISQSILDQFLQHLADGKTLKEALALTQDAISNSDAYADNPDQFVASEYLYFHRSYGDVLVRELHYGLTVGQVGLERPAQILYNDDGDVTYKWSSGSSVARAESFNIRVNAEGRIVDLLWRNRADGDVLHLLVNSVGQVEMAPGSRYGALPNGLDFELGTEHPEKTFGYIRMHSTPFGINLVR